MAANRVLIVDDEGELAFTLAERLSLRGFEAEGVDSGEAAIRRLRAGGVDVVVLDVKMPGIGGMGVIRAIKAECPGLPVIMVTGHGSRESAEEGMRAGAFRYLMKPVRIEALVDLLREAVCPEGGGR